MQNSDGSNDNDSLGIQGAVINSISAQLQVAASHRHSVSHTLIFSFVMAFGSVTQEREANRKRDRS